MAKKVQKAKAAKKPVKPAKKVVAKKPAPKKPAKPTKKPVAKKPTPKKVVKPAKPVKKTGAKKPAKPIKKVAPKKAVKPTKKVIAKPAKKVTPKKAVKPVKKAVAKPVAKKAIATKPIKPVKKAEVKKPAKQAKPVAKPVIKKAVAPVQKTVAKAVAKPTAKEVVKAKPVAPVAKPVVSKPAPVAKKKQNYDLDDDGSKGSSYEAPLVVEYKTPTIHKPMGPTPKPHINTDTRTRYNDVELKEFKELILKKLAEAQKDYELLKSTLSHKDDHGTDDTSPTFKLLEDGSDVLSKEETAHLAGRQEKFIQNLQNALIRIENKTYGICRVTGKLISKERLKSVPHATLAIEAKLGQNA